MLVAALVFAGTHPKVKAPTVDPISLGVYYDAVEFLSEDGVSLEAWLVPVLDAKRVLAQKEKVLKQKYPAVVLVHDFGASRQQMLPLVQPLHNAGVVVLVPDLRGGCATRRGQTFGLNEAMDVRSAVEMLRRRSYVDEKRIAVVGVGTGATAALLAAETDPTIAAIVLDEPVEHAEDMIAERVGPKQSWLSWMNPLCKWTFELAYKVDAEDMNLDRYMKLMESRPVLMMDNRFSQTNRFRPAAIEQIEAYLRRYLLVDSKDSMAEVR
jgi:pimeloyl-ACP methyl ester carboxylesterase